MVVSKADAAHLLRRTGYRVDPERLAEIMALPSRAAAVDRVLDISANPPVQLPISTGKSLDNFQSWRDLTYWWLERMRTSPTPIVEKMALFWHGHFTSGLDKVGDMGVLAEQHLTLRQHALGDFHALAQAMSVDPGMLGYLDNWLNYAGKPQENFARELMELFTLGRGAFTQADVTTMARAWTGHGLDDALRNYQFHPERHDGTPGTLFGLKRSWDGPAALTEILKGAKATVSSKFVATALYSHFVYPVAPSHGEIPGLAYKFRQSGLNILELLRAILNNGTFWSTRARRALVRPPIEWLVASLQATDLPATKIPVKTLVACGQTPFQPPDVNGWGENEDWLSTSQMWGRSEWAYAARIYGWQTQVLAETQTMSPAAAVQAAFDRFGISEPSASTRAALEACVQHTINLGGPWLIPGQLIELTMLSPDFMVA